MLDLDGEQKERFSEFFSLFENILRMYGLDLRFDKGEVYDMIKERSFPCFTYSCLSSDGSSYTSLAIREVKE